MALSRFASTCIGVWPEKIDSDRGSQLVGAEIEGAQGSLEKD